MWHADGAVQKRLLGKADLTFAKALEVAELEEMAARDAAQLHEGQPKDVHCMSGPPRRGGNRDNPGTPTGPCYRCGRNHLPNQCRFQWERCRFCKLQGHAERVCRKKMKAESMREASWIKELKGDSIGLTLKTAQMGKRFMEWKSHPAIHSNSGRHTNQLERLKLVVVDGLGPPLMGRNWLNRIPIDWGEIKVLRAGDEKQSRTLRLKRLLETYPGIQKEQGTLKGTKAHLPLKEGATPVFLIGQTSTLQFADKSGEGRGGNHCTGVYQ
ncbi:hypothetical protein EMCRGX_G032842 [Ephydatia muelleri]